jgi:hypothetical protein
MAAGPSEHGTQNVSYLRTLLNRKPARPARRLRARLCHRGWPAGHLERAGDTPDRSENISNNPERSVVLRSACGYAG